MNKLMLIEKDLEYGKALANAISNLHNEFELSLFDLGEYKHGEKNITFDSYDLFLVGGYSNEEIEAFRLKHFNKSKLVILTEDETETITKQSQNHEEGYWYINKYVNISSLITDINYLTGLITGKKRIARKSFHTNFIGFFGMSGGVGKTVISISTSRELSRYRDKRVLYLSFEEISTTELFIKNNTQSRNIGDYLYYLLEGHNENLCSHLDGFTFTDEFGVETFLSSDGRNDLKYLTKDELIYLIKVLSDSCRYDYIIFDLGNDLSTETLLLLEQCSKIILVMGENPVSEYKNNKLISYLSKINLAQYEDGLLCVVNKLRSVMSEMDAGETVDFKPHNCKNIYIENDENSFHYAEGHLDININHSFGLGIKQIATEILSLSH